METEIAKRIHDHGGTAYYVGGYVRDKYWGIESKDIDIEVFGIEQAKLEEILEPFDANYVGKAFGVYMVGDIEISLPRKAEIKTGDKHTDFTVEIDPFLTLEQAALRRDFTINTGMVEVLGGNEFYPVDNYDLENKILRPTSHAFMEDPLRVLRGMQFISRFGLYPSQLAINYSYAIKDKMFTLSSERIWGEWWKWAKGLHADKGLNFLQATGWIDNYTYLKKMVGFPQDLVWHPEGDVWTHSVLTVRGACLHKNPILTLAALLHDIAKPTTTEFGERITSKNHASEAELMVKAFLQHAPHDVMYAVVDLVREHMIHLNPPNKRTARRLLYRLQHAKWQDLQNLIKADHAARPPLDPTEPANSVKLFKLCQEVEDSIAPILQGRHLIEMGFEPGPKFGPALNWVYECQLDGQVWDLESAKSQLKIGIESNVFTL